MVVFLIPILFLLLPPIIFYSCGVSIKKTNPDKAKICYIMAVVYLIIGLGVCGSLIRI